MRTRKTYHFFLLISVIAIGSAFTYQNDGVDPEDFKRAYTDNVVAYSKTNVDGAVNYTLKYIPNELQVISSYRNGIVNEVEATSWLKEGKEEVNFMLQIEIPENGRQEFLKYESEDYDYEGRVKYYSFEFSKAIEATIDGAKVTIASFNFERDFGMSPKGTMTFSIQQPPKGKELTLKFKDDVYGTTEQTFQFDLTEFNALPRLKKIKKWKNHNS